MDLISKGDFQLKFSGGFCNWNNFQSKEDGGGKLKIPSGETSCEARINASTTGFVALVIKIGAYDAG